MVERMRRHWLEMEPRRLWRAVQKVWRSSLLGKVAVILAAPILAAAIISVGYLLLFGGSLV
jgi:hypothetical protein